MAHVDWEDALEIVVGFLEAPPAADTEDGKRFDQALLRVLANAPTADHDDGAAAPADSVAGLDEGLRARLDALARRRAHANPFGDHPDGIGPTLGMDLSGS
ncbi:hypothetical protein [Caulobacter sp. UNC279MFTsu5.1]|uniref:hypothetical protein n=1 Tax=Caulobacter sp. UNC279MFTsu5.1 TaxID=1502775 RepID=UPI0003828E32|nr:hypothetical protein [Caulobacter sp. UNC279MFTsu5.1]SFI60987.1 hypothetical protein SAMN02799626_00251 [Caulobacter sp. UNC279MFTsu5.1]